MSKQVEVFVMLLLAWVLLVWPFGLPAGRQDLAAGVLAALGAAALMREPRGARVPVWFRPARMGWLLVYLVVLAGYVVRANLDVAYRVLHPRMPIRPGIVKIRTALATAPAITLLANSITLTPGTLTVNALEDGTMYVHWICVRDESVEGATERIARRLEWFVKRIME